VWWWGVAERREQGAKGGRERREREGEGRGGGGGGGGGGVM